MGVWGSNVRREAEAERVLVAVVLPVLVVGGLVEA